MTNKDRKMPRQTWPENDKLVELLVTMDIAMDPAELQGVIVGRVAGAPLATKEEHLLAFADTFGDLALTPNCKDVFTNATDALMSALSDKDRLDLPKLFPEQSLPLAERLEALAAWCRGFLFGLGLAGMSEEQSHVPEVQGAIEDIRQISCVGVIDSDEQEGQEEAMMELIEYVRLVPFMVYTTLHNENANREGSSE